MRFTKDTEMVVREALRELAENKRVNITAYLGDGWYCLSVDEMVGVLSGQIETIRANALGVSEERLKEWDKHFHRDFCNAKTTAGRRCRNHPEMEYDPRKFRPEVNSFCRIHGGKS